MKKLIAPFLALLFFASCGMENMNDILPDQELSSTDLLSEGVGTDLLNTNMRLASSDDDCITPGSLDFYPVTDEATRSSGKNTKSVSYSAYNTETDFVVEVTYAITAGKSKAKATISIAIDGDEAEYTEVSSGSTVSHTVPLAEDWVGGDQVAFSVLQEGLGTPITFSESYDLIPVCEEVSLEIGNEYQGGIIAYILQDGDPGYVAGETHGIIAAPSDQSDGIQWWNGSFTTTGATGTALGTGQTNTTAIVNTYGAGSYAAKLCNDLVLDGYDDWYLPSKDELNKLYLSKDAIGGFVENFYWSSSEFNNTKAWKQEFNLGFPFDSFKDTPGRVRAVRAFNSELPLSLEIGDAYQGGIIAYILQPGDPDYVAGKTHGIIAAPSDQSTSIEWYKGSFTTTLATGTALGTGQANTLSIVNAFGSGNYAAQLCNDLELGGYEDWYLPSKDELNKLYLNRMAIGGFVENFYWSSSEGSNFDAWVQNFLNGNQDVFTNLTFTSRIRAIRSF